MSAVEKIRAAYGRQEDIYKAGFVRWNDTEHRAIGVLLAEIDRLWAAYGKLAQEGGP